MRNTEKTTTVSANSPRRLLSTSEVAKAVGCDPSYIRLLARRGELPIAAISSAGRLFDVADLGRLGRPILRRSRNKLVAGFASTRPVSEAAPACQGSARPGK